MIRLTGPDELFRWCVYCDADCWIEGTGQHASDCPSRTGLWPVDVDMRCARCGVLMVGGVDVAVEERIGEFIGIPVYQRVCLGCAAGESCPSPS